MLEGQGSLQSAGLERILHFGDHTGGLPHPEKLPLVPFLCFDLAGLGEERLLDDAPGEVRKKVFGDTFGPDDVIIENGSKGFGLRVRAADHLVGKAVHLVPNRRELLLLLQFLIDQLQALQRLEKDVVV